VDHVECRGEGACRGGGAVGARRRRLLGAGFDDGDAFADGRNLAEDLDLIIGAEGSKLGSYLCTEGVHRLHDGIVLNLALFLQGIDFGGQRLEIGGYQILNYLPKTSDHV
jgi:hypothetical protein